MIRMRPKNWDEFQHYRDRDPPWIKLHKRLLDDSAYNSLPIASMALAPLLWLIASGNKDGWFDGTPSEIAFRLRWAVKNVDLGLKPLIATGFFICEHDASKCLQDATPERETQVKAEQREILPDKPGEKYPDDFLAFWKAYPTDPNMSKKDSFKQWQRLSPPKREQATAAIPGFRAYCEKNNSWYRTIYAERFLSQEKFEGYIEASLLDPAVPPAELEALKDRIDKKLRRGAYAENYQ